MNHLREFLENSTIHGLVHIANEKSNTGKAGWIFLVVSCFAFSTFLIQSSFSSWIDSPVSTTITTHDISSMEFPPVVVCPPKDLGIALNYDISRLSNMTLTTQEKEELKEVVRKAFIHSPIKQLVSKMMSLTNEENYRSIFKGIQSFRTQRLDENNMYDIQLSATEGTIHSPGYGQLLGREQAQQLQGMKIQYRLELDNIKDTIGENGVLKLKFQVENGTSVETGKRPVYKIYDEKLGGYEAERYCIEQGGHLASVSSKEDMEEMDKALHGRIISFLMGGSDKGLEGHWTWTDGNPWSYENWEVGYGQTDITRNCLLSGVTGTWRDVSCVPFYVFGKGFQNKYPFMCKFEPNTITETTELEFTRKELDFVAFYIWFSTKQQERTNQGFKFSWKVEKPWPDMEVEVEETEGKVESPGLGEELDESWWSEKHQHRASLLITQKMVEVVGREGRLVVEVEVDAGEGEVVVGRGDDRKWVKSEMQRMWHQGKEECSAAGGSFASVTNSSEKGEMEEASGLSTVWLGGSWAEDAQEWQWADGAAWNYTNWDSGYPRANSKETCLTSLEESGKFMWRHQECSMVTSYVCRYNTRVFKGLTNTTMEFLLDDLPLPALHITFRHPVIVYMDMDYGQLSIVWTVSMMDSF